MQPGFRSLSMMRMMLADARLGEGQASRHCRYGRRTATCATRCVPTLQAEAPHPLHVELGGDSAAECGEMFNHIGR